MLIVTHEMGFAAHVADRIAFIDDGRILDEGPPAACLPREPRAARAAVLPDLPRPQQLLTAPLGIAKRRASPRNDKPLK